MPIFEVLDFDGSKVTLLIAFASGIITFFASCLMPLVPTYLAYLSGISLSEKQVDTKKRIKLLAVGLSFILGFVVTFTLMGLGVRSISSILNLHHQLFQRLAGVVFIVLGLLILGLVHPNFLGKERKIPLQGLLKKYRLVHAFLTGMALAFSWTPCIGPVLAVILYWASQTKTALHGTFLLITFGLGVGFPFLVITAIFEKLLPLLKKYAKISHYLSLLSGVIVLVVGVLLATGQFQIASAMILRFVSQHFKTV